MVVDKIIVKTHDNSVLTWFSLFIVHLQGSSEMAQLKQELAQQLKQERQEQRENILELKQLQQLLQEGLNAAQKQLADNARAEKAEQKLEQLRLLIWDAREQGDQQLEGLQEDQQQLKKFLEELKQEVTQLSESSEGLRECDQGSEGFSESL